MGVRGAIGRLVEFGQCEHGAQLEAPRFLLLRDGDSGEKGVLGRRGVRGIAL